MCVDADSESLSPDTQHDVRSLVYFLETTCTGCSGGGGGVGVGGIGSKLYTCCMLINTTLVSGSLAFTTPLVHNFIHISHVNRVT